MFLTAITRAEPGLDNPDTFDPSCSEVSMTTGREANRSLAEQLELEQTQYSIGLRAAPPSVPVDSAGRFFVVDVVGRGAMGCVFRAVDKKLGRKVALKAVRVGDRNKRIREQRLKREALALAKIKHDHVLTIHDLVEAQNGELLLATDLVNGQELGEWQKKKTLADIICMYIEAGEGLAAAHAEGLVHRDFKPSNVMVDESGPTSKAVVCDFGLAGADFPIPPEKLADPQSENSIRTRGAIGTPGYWSPEQQRGEAADARSDQYSFCASLWEAVVGSRPTSASLDRRPANLPRWLFPILRRGLAQSPDARYPELSILLRTIKAAPVRRRKLQKIFVTTLFFSAALSVALLLFGYKDPCRDAGAAISQVWVPKRDGVRSHLTALGYPQLGEYAAQRLDRATEEWSAQKYEVCTLQRNQRNAKTSAREACLERWSSRLPERVTQIASADANFVPHIPGLLETIGELADGCQSPLAEVRPSIQGKLERALELERTGAYPTSQQLLNDALNSAQASAARCSDPAYAAELAAVFYRLGHLQGEQENPAAIDNINRAARHAFACKLDLLYLDAKLFAAKIYAQDLEDPESTKRTLSDAKAALARVGQDQALRKYEYHEAAGLFARLQGRLDDAADAHQRALAQLGSGHQYVLREVEALVNLGAVRYDAGESEQAQKLFSRARAIIEENFGDAPLIVREKLALNLAIIRSDAGDPQTLEVLEPALRSKLPGIRLSAAAVGLVYTGQQKLETETRDLIKAVQEDVHTPNIPNRAAAEGFSQAGIALYALTEDDDRQALQQAVTLLQLGLNRWRLVAPNSEGRYIAELMLAEALAQSG